jgi:hypothetical protein
MNKLVTNLYYAYDYFVGSDTLQDIVARAGSLQTQICNDAPKTSHRHGCARFRLLGPHNLRHRKRTSSLVVQNATYSDLS